MSTQITEAPRIHAIPLRMVMIHPRSSFESTIVSDCASVVLSTIALLHEGFSRQPCLLARPECNPITCGRGSLVPRAGWADQRSTVRN